ncbi:MAG: DUF6297 family protein [Nocardioides sp.]|nr:DUF6297 family protein [Nocardioides sp.]
MRHWRRGHADTKLSEAISNAYIALFAVAMLGSILVNVIVNVARLSDELCTSAGCREGRSLLPYLVAAGSLAVVLALSRMFGPVFTSPAVASWLMSTPADRGALLRPRVWRTVVIAAVVTAALAAAATTMGRFGTSAILGQSIAVALVSVLTVAIAVLGQAGKGLLPRLLSWALTFALWVVLLLLAMHRAPLLDAPEALTSSGVSTIVALGVVALIVLLAALRRTPRLHRRDIAAGGNLAPGLSGAMSNLDLALMYDVLLAHRWRARGSVRSRRGGPVGAGALVWADLRRVVRSPQWLVLIAAAVVVPYAVEVAGAERVVFLLAALMGFLTGLPLLTGLRVLTRSASIIRMLPFPLGLARRVSVYVALGILVAYGLATVPALHDSLDVPWTVAFMLGLAVGGSALASAARWVTGKPPDYGRPLVSSPSGAIPTNLYGSALRGFDVLLLTCAPVLISPSDITALISLGISAVVVSIVTAPQQQQKN